VKSRNRNGFILLAVVVLFPLIGLAMILLTSQTAQWVVETRQIQQQAELTNLYLSMCEYIEANRQSLIRPDAPENQVVPIERITADPATASIQISRTGPSDRTILLTIRLRNKTGVIQRKWTLRLAETIPATNTSGIPSKEVEPKPNTQSNLGKGVVRSCRDLEERA
jgi:hypothetical protein